MFALKLLFLACAVGVAESSVNYCQKATQAFTMGDITYFRTNLQMIQMKNLAMESVRPNLPSRFNTQSAIVILPETGEYVLIDDGHHGVYPPEVLDGPKHRDVANFPTGVHVDAATVRGLDIFLFEGDKYQIMEFDISAPKPMSDLGLPNDVDAAWHEPTLKATIVLKGDQIWLADDDDQENENSTVKFEGPLPFDLFFDVPTLVLCKS